MVSHDDGRHSFVLKNYNLLKPFASFLPGIGGGHGIPIWVFYVSRGQGVCSFGFEDKHHSIMEFLPANQAYQLTTQQGFRTYYRVKRTRGDMLYEPFQYPPEEEKTQIEQQMIINPASIRLVDTNRCLGLETFTEYFPVVNDNFGGLIRSVTIRNISPLALDLEILDGLPVIIPCGIDDENLKHRRYLMEAFIETEWVKKKIPMFRIKMEQQDSPEVSVIQSGHFGLCFQHFAGKDKLLRPIVDPQKIYGPIKDYSYPWFFTQSRAEPKVLSEQGGNQFPCFFNFRKITLPQQAKIKLNYIFGRVSRSAKLDTRIPRIARESYVLKKAAENRMIISDITQKLLTVSAHEHFNQYCRQTFLDNVLRGGFPERVGSENGTATLYVYHRKHGDLERDYNNFRLSATYYSQGTGNYRDINQNRRNDAYINPGIGASNILLFMNLLQLDGYNPLVVKETCYRLKPEAVSAILRKFNLTKKRQIIKKRLLRPFLPGELLAALEAGNYIQGAESEDFLADILKQAVPETNAEHGEGFWTDHWTYNLDMIKSYFFLYPDKLKYLFLGLNKFTYFDNAYCVRPRSGRYCLENSQVVQLHSVRRDEIKEAIIAQRKDAANIVRTKYGKGKIYKTNLLEKFICVLLNKLATLDPSGMGVEMEADKPDWYDALNGLPAELGSSISETMELKRWIVFLRTTLEKLRLDSVFKLSVPVEMGTFFMEMLKLLQAKRHFQAAENDFRFWVQANASKEKYRKETQYGVLGAKTVLSLSQLKTFLELALAKVSKGIEQAFDQKTGIYRTYFRHKVINWKKRRTKSGQDIIIPLVFKREALPYFLEGNVHALRMDEKKKGGGRQLYQNIKKSGLYDKKLRMYKVNVSLASQSIDIGRTRAFTPGWLENESIWLHMEYKYLLELIRNGLYDEFYAEMENVLIPFLPPEQYGRSIYENSSFIVSSAHPDKSRHGKGYYARLSGSTAEFIHIWLLMSIGAVPFFINSDEKINLNFKPVLRADFFLYKSKTIEYMLTFGKQVQFIPKNAYGFLFLGQTFVVYHNPARKNTYGKNGATIERMILHDTQGKQNEITGAIIPAPLAEAVRQGAYQRIDVYFQSCLPS